MKSWFLFDNNVFPVKIMFFIGKRDEMFRSAVDGMKSCDSTMSREEVEEAAAVMRRSFGDDACGADGDCLSISLDSGARMQIIRMDSFDGTIHATATLSHECLHAALAVLGHCGVSENPPFEALCYLHEAVLERFMTDAFGRINMLGSTKEDAMEGSSKKAKEKKT